MKTKNPGTDAAPKQPVKIPIAGLKPFPPFLGNKSEASIPKKPPVPKAISKPVKLSKPEVVVKPIDEPAPHKSKLTPKDRAKLRKFVDAGKLKHTWGDPWRITPELLALLDQPAPSKKETKK